MSGPNRSSFTGSYLQSLFNLFGKTRFFFDRKPRSTIVIDRAAPFATCISTRVYADNIFTLTALKMINGKKINFWLIKDIFTDDDGFIL